MFDFEHDSYGIFCVIFMFEPFILHWNCVLIAIDGEKRLNLNDFEVEFDVLVGRNDSIVCAIVLYAESLNISIYCSFLSCKLIK